VPVVSRYIREASGQISYISSNVIRNGKWKGAPEEWRELENAGTRFNPRGEVRDSQKGLPRSESKSATNEGEWKLDIMYAVEVEPFIRKGGNLMSREGKGEQSSKSFVGGYSYTACGNGH
jgi:hypothetical protein